MNELTPAEIESKLYVLPSLIGKKALEAENALERQLVAEAEYDRLKARSYLMFKAENPQATQKEIEAFVLNSEVVHEARLDAIKLEATARKFKAEMVQLDNEFTAVKKIVSLKEMELRSGV